MALISLLSEDKVTSSRKEGLAPFFLHPIRFSLFLVNSGDALHGRFIRDNHPYPDPFLSLLFFRPIHRKALAPSSFDFSTKIMHARTARPHFRFACGRGQRIFPQLRPAFGANPPFFYLCSADLAVQTGIFGNHAQPALLNVLVDCFHINFRCLSHLSHCGTRVFL